MRILLIEDDPAIVRVLERGLQSHGHQVVSAYNGEDGVLLASDESVEFVLLDIALPGPDGHQVLSDIRARRPGLPVLMLTARDDLENKVNALRSGADDYLAICWDGTTGTAASGEAILVSSGISVSNWHRRADQRVAPLLWSRSLSGSWRGRYGPLGRLGNCDGQSGQNCPEAGGLTDNIKHVWRQKIVEVCYQIPSDL